MIATNLTLSESLDVKISLGQSLFPNYDSPEDIKKNYEEIKDNLIENIE